MSLRKKHARLLENPHRMRIMYDFYIGVSFALVIVFADFIESFLNYLGFEFGWMISPFIVVISIFIFKYIVIYSIMPGDEDKESGKK